MINRAALPGADQRRRVIGKINDRYERIQANSGNMILTGLNRVIFRPELGKGRNEKQRK